MEIRPYNKNKDEGKLMKLLENEGDEWSCYWAKEVCEKYKAALALSITFVAYEGDVLCGYSRSLDDCGFYIYVCDLLVMPQFRGRNIGRKLMECIYDKYPDCIVYVMSDVDAYYKKLGYRQGGSVFEVHNNKQEK
ncbi:MAG: GNAT family N-acetyltransferase [Clostridiales bacterium]|nr:GNAT family N-acetyltransferase [Clostridiales bacterium]